MVRKISLLAILLALNFSTTLNAEDAGQMLPGQGDLSEFEKSLQKLKHSSESSIISSGVGEEDFSALENLEATGASPLIPGQSDEISPVDNPLRPGHGILGMDEDRESIRTYSKDDVLKDVVGRSESIFSLSYIKDDYDYSDSSNIFSKTYESSTGSVKGGMLLASLEKIILSKGIQATWGLGAGVGFNSGKGQFIDGTSSEADFKLYTLPLDFVLGAYLPLGQFAKLSVRGGPGVMGLIQNRSDFEKKAKGKEKRQIGYGYFGEAKFQLSLTNIFKDTAFYLYRDYKISQAYLDFKVRLHDYGNFQDEDLAISGQSFGIGFTFEYL